MNIKEIEELIHVFEQSKLTSLKVQDNEQTIEMAMKETAVSSVTEPEAVKPVVTTVAAAAKEETIVAPMVGTFYMAAHPGEEPFVHVGSDVTEDTTVCVLEAMKVFTEVPADMCGKITEILVKDGEFVEYGQPLFKVQCK